MKCKVRPCILGHSLYVSKVSTRLEFFLSEFAYEPVLILILAVLDAEFYSLSTGIIFNGCHPAKIKGLP